MKIGKLIDIFLLIIIYGIALICFIYLMITQTVNQSITLVLVLFVVYTHSFLIGLYRLRHK